MKTLVFFILTIFFLPSMAQEQQPPKEVELKLSHVQMHERMAKAHQQAVDCLNSGKSEDDCRKTFRDLCQQAGGSEMCASGMMNHRAGKKPKRP